MPLQDRHTSPHDHVSFEEPPLAEVALTVQFPANTIEIETAGVFAAFLRPNYPRREQQPVVLSMAETFDQPVLPQTLEIMVEPTTGLPRTWFVASDENRVVQLQHDRLSLNWRALGEGAHYPRYDKLEEEFEGLLNALIELIENEDRSISYDLVEVTYVNPIVVPFDATAPGHPDLADVLSRVVYAEDGTFLGEPEDAQYQARWRIPESEFGQGEDAPIGRLYLSAVPGLRPVDNTPIYVVNLAGRVKPAEQSVGGVIEALRIAHKWAVRGFESSTSKKMHDHWKKINAGESDD